MSLKSPWAAEVQALEQQAEDIRSPFTPAKQLPVAQLPAPSPVGLRQQPQQPQQPERDATFGEAFGAGVDRTLAGMEAISAIGRSAYGDDYGAIDDLNKAMRRFDSASRNLTAKPMSEWQDVGDFGQALKETFAQSLPGIAAIAATSVFGKKAVRGVLRAMGKKATPKIDSVAAWGSALPGSTIAVAPEFTQPLVMNTPERASWEAQFRQDRAQRLAQGDFQIGSNATWRDGDSFNMDGQEYRVLGMNTADRHQLGYKEATDRMQSLIGSGDFRFIDTGKTDHRNRKLVELFDMRDNDMSLAEKMYQSGSAMPYRGYDFLQNDYRLAAEGQNAEGALPMYATRSKYEKPADLSKMQFFDPAVNDKGQLSSLTEQGFRALTGSGIAGGLNLIPIFAVLDKGISAKVKNRAARMLLTGLVGGSSEVTTEAAETILSKNIQNMTDRDIKILGPETYQELKEVAALSFPLGFTFGAMGGVPSNEKYHSDRRMAKTFEAASKAYKSGAFREFEDTRVGGKKQAETASRNKKPDKTGDKKGNGFDWLFGPNASISDEVDTEIFGDKGVLDSDYVDDNAALYEQETDNSVIQMQNAMQDAFERAGWQGTEQEKDRIIDSAITNRYEETRFYSPDLFNAFGIGKHQKSMWSTSNENLKKDYDIQKETHRQATLNEKIEDELRNQNTPKATREAEKEGIARAIYDRLLSKSPAGKAAHLERELESAQTVMAEEQEILGYRIELGREKIGNPREILKGILARYYADSETAYEQEKDGMEAHERNGTKFNERQKDVFEVRKNYNQAVADISSAPMQMLEEHLAEMQSNPDYAKQFLEKYSFNYRRKNKVVNNIVGKTDANGKTYLDREREKSAQYTAPTFEEMGGVNGILDKVFVKAEVIDQPIGIETRVAPLNMAELTARNEDKPMYTPLRYVKDTPDSEYRSAIENKFAIEGTDMNSGDDVIINPKSLVDMVKDNVDNQRAYSLKNEGKYGQLLVESFEHAVTTLAAEYNILVSQAAPVVVDKKGNIEGDWYIGNRTVAKDGKNVKEPIYYMAEKLRNKMGSSDQTLRKFAEQLHTHLRQYQSKELKASDRAKVDTFLEGVNAPISEIINDIEIYLYPEAKLNAYQEFIGGKNAEQYIPGDPHPLLEKINPFGASGEFQTPANEARLSTEDVSSLGLMDRSGIVRNLRTLAYINGELAADPANNKLKAERKNVINQIGEVLEGLGAYENLQEGFAESDQQVKGQTDFIKNKQLRTIKNELNEALAGDPALRDDALIKELKDEIKAKEAQLVKDQYKGAPDPKNQPKAQEISTSTVEWVKALAGAVGNNNVPRLVTTEDVTKFLTKRKDDPEFKPLYEKLQEGKLDGLHVPNTVKGVGQDFVWVKPTQNVANYIKVVSHEIGHHIVKENWDKTDEKMRKRIFDAWVKWMQDTHPDAWAKVKDDPEFNSLFSSDSNAMFEANEHSMKFKEWLADQVGAWINTREKPKTLLQSFFSGIAKALQTLYRNFKIAEPVSEWMDGMWVGENTVKDAVSEVKRKQRTYASKIHRQLSSKNKSKAAEVVLAAYLNSEKVSSQIKGFLTAWDQILNKDDRGVLLDAMNSYPVKRKVETFLLNEAPGAFTEFTNDPRMQAAYTFVMYRAGKIDLGPKTKGVFRKLIKWVADVLGIVSKEQRAMEIINFMMDGDKAAMRKKRANYDAKIHSDKQLANTKIQKQVKRVRPYIESGLKTIGEVVLPVKDTISNNPHLHNVLKIIARDATHLGQGDSYEEVRYQRMAQFENQVALALKDIKDDPIAESQYLRIMNSPKQWNDKASPAVREAVKATKAYLAAMHGYLTEAGLDVGKMKNYFPFVTDVQALQSGRMEAASVLARHMTDEAARTERRWNSETQTNEVYVDKTLKVTDALKQRKAESIIDALIQQEGFGDANEASEGGNYNPYFGSIEPRTLKWMTDSEQAMREFNPFMSKSPQEILMNYTHQAVKRAEFNRVKPKIIAEYEKAYKTGASPDDIEKMNKLIRGILGIEGSEWMMQHPKLSKVAQAMTVVTNVAILSTSAITSMADVGGLFVRSNNVFDAFGALKDGISGKTSVKLVAEDIGAIESSFVDALLASGYESSFLTGKLKNINEGFFRMIGLNKVTSVTRMMGVSLASRMFQQWAANPKAHARDMAEMGLEKSDLKFDENGMLQRRTMQDQTRMMGAISKLVSKDKKSESDLKKLNQLRAELARAQRLDVAINRFVNSTLLKPSAAAKPGWANDAKYKIFFLLKGFMYQFWDTYHKRAYRALRYEKDASALLGMFTFVPLFMAAEALRDAIQHVGEDDPYKETLSEEELHKYYVTRSGVLGLTELLSESLSDIDRGDLPVDTIGGPVMGMLYKGAKSAANGTTANWLADMSPFQNLWQPISKELSEEY